MISDSDQVAVVEDERSAMLILNFSRYYLRARLAGRDDVKIWGPEGLRTHDGVLQVNFGEYRLSVGYLNEEWLAPDALYMRHECDDCAYPPSLCCMPVSDEGPWQDEDEDDRREYSELLYSYPSGAITKRVYLGAYIAERKQLRGN
jgi:hypothetical protein